MPYNNSIGDLFIKLKIDIPKVLSPKQEELIKQFHEDYGCDGKD